MNVPVSPVGYNVLVQIIPVQDKSEGGIILSGSANELERERKGRDIARIIEFGPIAYKGYSGCDTAEDWGVKEGDIVELSGRYDGKFTRASEYSERFKNFRYVNDQDILGLVKNELKEMILAQEKLEEE